MSTLTTRINDRLDDFEHQLPAPLSSSLKLQRSIADRASAGVCRTAAAIGETGRRAAQVNMWALRTITGTARRATAESARATRTLLGQTRAQTARMRETTTTALADVADTLRTAAGDVADRTEAALDAADASISAPTGTTNERFEDLTKAELYRRAKALDIEGRSSMTKDELVTALARAA